MPIAEQVNSAEPPALTATFTGGTVIVGGTGNGEWQYGNEKTAVAMYVVD